MLTVTPHRRTMNIQGKTAVNFRPRGGKKTEVVHALSLFSSSRVYQRRALPGGGGGAAATGPRPHAELLPPPPRIGSAPPPRIGSAPPPRMGTGGGGGAHCRAGGAAMASSTFFPPRAAKRCAASCQVAVAGSTGTGAAAGRQRRLRFHWGHHPSSPGCCQGQTWGVRRRPVLGQVRS